MGSSDDVTRLLARYRTGDEEAWPELFSAVYAELHRLAEQHLRRERAGHTLQPTALVNEAYLRLVQQHNHDWNDRQHFLAIAATAMRRILVTHAQEKRAQKRPDPGQRVTLFEAAGVFEERAEDLLALDEALARLEQLDHQKCRVVELRFFTGLGVEETARILGLSPRTVERDWRFAKAWLRKELAV